MSTGPGDRIAPAWGDGSDSDPTRRTEMRKGRRRLVLLVPAVVIVGLTIVGSWVLLGPSGR